MKEKKGNRNCVPENQEEALILALKLAITAPSRTDLELVNDLIKDLVCGMSEIDVARCKRRAIKELEVARYG